MARLAPTEVDLYDLSTPLLDKFMQRVRKHVRFPRYYDHSANW